MIANRVYPGLLHHRRFARNGMVPDARFAKGLIVRQNHVLAYRRKTFLSSGDWDNLLTGSGGSTVQHRFRCHTGYGATHIAFDVGLGLDDSGTGVGTDPRVTIDVTEAGGATTTETLHYGINTGVPDESPDSVAWFAPKVAVDPDTTYEVTVTAIDYARVVSIGAHEVASNVIDESVQFFIEDNPSLFFPIYDRMRFLLLGGLSEMWKRNGSHLLTWSGNNGAASPTFTSTTWTNVIDSTTAVAGPSAGYYLGADSQTLEPHCRISTPTQMHVVLAAHASCAGGSTGEVRLQDSTGTHLSLTGITSTSQWHTTTTSFADVTAFQRLDLQARVAAGGSTLTLNAVSLYAYVT